MPIAVFAVARPWQEYTAVWANQNTNFIGSATQLVIYSTKVVDRNAVSVDFDLTSYVQDIIDLKVRNNGIMLLDIRDFTAVAGEGPPAPEDGIIFFQSREGTPAASRPSVSVTYRRPALITDAIKDAWRRYWPAVDTSAVVASPLRIAQPLTFQ